MLSSSEIWHGVTQHELEKLEQVDEMFMRNFMECSYSVPKDLLYLELGVLPIRYIIQTIRLLYLHHVLQQKKESLLFKFFIAQISNPTPKVLGEPSVGRFSRVRKTPGIRRNSKYEKKIL